ncbi:MAG: NADH-ubiquinone oxidoreductase-F iron-sulfur binding region domain-containing protein [Acidimicrobiia bacterium]
MASNSAKWIFWAIFSEALASVRHVMVDATICGLGQAAPNPIRSAMEFILEDLES